MGVAQCDTAESSISPTFIWVYNNLFPVMLKFSILYQESDFMCKDTVYMYKFHSLMGIKTFIRFVQLIINMCQYHKYIINVFPEQLWCQWKSNLCF